MANATLPRTRLSISLLAGVPLLALLIIGGWLGWGVLHQGPPLVPLTAGQVVAPPASPEMEAKWGIRVTQIGVTADGGMLDFRYIVIDPDKAQAIAELQNVPILIDEQTGTEINSAALMIHRTSLQAGATYFFLYRNTDGAVQRGHTVTVKLGDLKLEHVVAQ